MIWPIPQMSTAHCISRKLYCLFRKHDRTFQIRAVRGNDKQREIRDDDGFLLAKFDPEKKTTAWPCRMKVIQEYVVEKNSATVWARLLTLISRITEEVALTATDLRISVLESPPNIFPVCVGKVVPSLHGSSMLREGYFRNSRQRIRMRKSGYSSSLTRLGEQTDASSSPFFIIDIRLTDVISGKPER